MGGLRFAPPEPAEYSGTINATTYGPACLQRTPDYASAFGDLVGPYGQSEDCLQLNVMVPRDVITIGTGFPVLVFVHGGGFFGGSANTVDGSLLLSTATEMVSLMSRAWLMNRTSLSFTSLSSIALAFSGSRRPSDLACLERGLTGRLLSDLADEGMTNLGLRDVKLALEWVQANIRSFRGDPTKVSALDEPKVVRPPS